LCGNRGGSLRRFDSGAAADLQNVIAGKPVANPRMIERQQARPYVFGAGRSSHEAIIATQAAVTGNS